MQHFGSGFGQDPSEPWGDTAVAIVGMAYQDTDEDALDIDAASWDGEDTEATQSGSGGAQWSVRRPDDGGPYRVYVAPYSPKLVEALEHAVAALGAQVEVHAWAQDPDSVAGPPDSPECTPLPPG